MVWRYYVTEIHLAKKERFKDFEWYSSDDVRRILDKYGDNEWELVNVIPSTTYHRGDVGQEDTISIMAIFKQPSP